MFTSNLFDCLPISQTLRWAGYQARRRRNERDFEACSAYYLKTFYSTYRNKETRTRMPLFDAFKFRESCDQPVTWHVPWWWALASDERYRSDFFQGRQKVWREARSREDSMDSKEKEKFAGASACCTPRRGRPHGFGPSRAQQVRTKLVDKELNLPIWKRTACFPITQMKGQSERCVNHRLVDYCPRLVPQTRTILQHRVPATSQDEIGYTPHQPETPDPLCDYVEHPETMILRNEALRKGSGNGKSVSSNENNSGDRRELIAWPHGHVRFYKSKAEQPYRSGLENEISKHRNSYLASPPAHERRTAGFGGRVAGGPNSEASSQLTSLQSPTDRNCHEKRIDSDVRVAGQLRELRAPAHPISDGHKHSPTHLSACCRMQPLHFCHKHLDLVADGVVDYLDHRDHRDHHGSGPMLDCAWHQGHGDIHTYTHSPFPHTQPQGISPQGFPTSCESHKCQTYQSHCDHRHDSFKDHIPHHGEDTRLRYGGTSQQPRPNNGFRDDHKIQDSTHVWHGQHRYDGDTCLGHGRDSGRNVSYERTRNRVKAL